MDFTSYQTMTAILAYSNNIDVGKLAKTVQMLASVHVDIVSKIMKLCDYGAANDLKSIAHNWNQPNCSL